MINHARTLLLNARGPHAESRAIPGDAYVPPYTPTLVPASIGSLRSLLFGNDPDDEGLAYRTGQYMSVLHSTPFEDYVFALDPRITYVPDNPGLLSGYGLFVTPANDILEATGTFPDEPTGRVSTTWDASVASGTLHLSNGISGEATSTALVLTNGVTQPVQLPGTTMTAVLHAAALEDLDGRSWEILSRKRPYPELPAILAQCQGPWLEPLFQAASEEPFRTFREMYGSKDFCLSMSGLLLALIYYTENLRDA